MMADSGHFTQNFFPEPRAPSDPFVIALLTLIISGQWPANQMARPRLNLASLVCWWPTHAAKSEFAIEA